MWSEKQKNSYSLEEFQMFCEYVQENNLEATVENLLNFLRLLRAIVENE